MKLLRRLFPARSSAFPPPKPDAPFHAIGDVHGCARQLRALVERARAAAPDAPIVCVGDYVDRGEHSREALAFLMDQTAARPGDFICLAGNHEQMLLDFLADPSGRTDRWLRHGGLQTLASFGVGLPEKTAPARNERLRDALLGAMGGAALDWLRGLNPCWRSGNVAVVHAGADPRLPLEAQRPHDLIWGHADFGRMPRPDGVWVVHGHTIVPKPRIGTGTISIDTGAYATGRLTAARIAADGVTFLET